ncbi:MAG: CinA family protein, partial [Bacteriovoracaceae bacterium]
GKVASLPYLYGVDITVRLESNSSEEMKGKKKSLEDFILKHPLKEYIWHLGEESLEECIIKKAKELNVRFGFAESCTGGLCSDKITNINGSSSVFYGSLICYHTEIKTKFLGIAPNIIDQYDVVSAPVATQMASGLRSLFPIDLAISLTGYAGPHSKEDEIPVGTVFVGVSSQLGDMAFHHHFVGDRERLKEYFYQVALFRLLETLEKLALR